MFLAEINNCQSFRATTKKKLGAKRDDNARAYV